jgi:hypothetical protein
VPDPRFLVFTRDGCALCDEFILELTQALASTSEAFGIRDVDADATTARRFGLKVPLLTCDGSVVCHGHLDAAAVARLTAR